MPYYYPYYYGNSSGLLLVLVCAVFALWASANVNSTFKKYAAQRSVRGITGAQAAQRVLSANGVTDVRIERVGGNLTDHFDPKTNVIRLSDSVYSSTSTAAIGVACHEAGHAVQYAQSYAPIKIRAAIIPITNFGSKLAMPLILLGTVLPIIGEFSYVLVYIGIACFGLSVLFQLITLPVEFNASRRAMEAIQSAGLLTDEEQKGAKKTLKAAAMTYVAATATALAQMLRLIIIFGGRGRRRRD
jgi:Zn-dependent membrane protease YugP